MADTAEQIRLAFARRLELEPATPNFRERVASAVAEQPRHPRSYRVAAAISLLLVAGTAALLLHAREVTTRSLEPAAAFAAALAQAASHGFSDCSSSVFTPSAQLHALVCVHPGATSTSQMTFFFVGSTFVGTDTPDPSAHINGTRVDKATVALTYALYRPNDANCCPTGGSALIRFHWDGTRLQPLDPVPSSRIEAELSRR